MQAKLTIDEFAYLLHGLQAQQLIGVDNARLFPVDETSRNSLLDQGFNALQEHGWLQADGTGFRTHTGLVLMCAVIAQPEQTIMLKRRLSGGAEQIITYYLAQGLVVEQFLTSDQEHLLTQLDTYTDLIQRLQQALQIPAVNEKWPAAVTLDANSFESAMKQARSDDNSALAAAIQEAQVDAGDIDQLATLIGGMRPIAELETAALSGQQLLDWHAMIILRGPDQTVWAMTTVQETNSVTLRPLDSEQLASQLSTAAQLQQANGQPR